MTHDAYKNTIFKKKKMRKKIKITQSKSHWLGSCEIKKNLYFMFLW